MGFFVRCVDLSIVTVDEFFDDNKFPLFAWFFVLNENHVLFFDDCLVFFSGCSMIFPKSRLINGDKNPFLN